MSIANKTLITRADIAKYKQISKTVDPAILNPFIITAQRVDVAPLLGDDLFNDIMRNTENYGDLLDGGDYIYDGKTYENYGLKAVIAHFAYARYIYFGSNVDTPFGNVNKVNGNNSVPTSETSKRAMYNEAQREAVGLFSNLENYLIRENVELFRNNECYGGTAINSHGGFGFSHIINN